MNEQHLAPDQLAVLTPHSPKHSLLRAETQLAGIPLTSEHSQWPGHIFHSSIGRFKGLEADVVLFADCDSSDPRCDRTARYIAASRARHQLIVLEKRPGSFWAD